MVVSFLLVMGSNQLIWNFSPTSSASFRHILDNNYISVKSELILEILYSLFKKGLCNLVIHKIDGDLMKNSETKQTNILLNGQQQVIQSVAKA